MGRHRRADPTATPHAPAPSPTSTAHPGRHRGIRRRPAAARTGLLGASAALTLGAAAVSSGLIPGADTTFSVGDTGPGGSVQAGGPGGEKPRGGVSGSPTDRASRSTDRDSLRDGSATPSERTSRSPQKPESKAGDAGDPGRTASPSAPAEPPGTPSATGSAGDGAEDPSGGSGGTGGGEGGGSAPTATRSAEDGSGPAATAEARVLSLVNTERAKAGCSPVVADPELAALAESHSEDMAERGYFSHTTPDGRSPWDRADAAGVDHMGGENIARGQADAETVMESWMNSPGHRANILNCDFRTLGVGAHFAQGGPWWTQAFGY